MVVELGTDEGQHVADDRGELAGLPGHDRACQQGANPREYVRRPVSVAHDGGERLADVVDRGLSEASQWRQALASATMAARGWLIS